MRAKDTMELMIDMLKKVGMEEYEALTLICQLLEEEAYGFLMMDYYHNFIDRNSDFNPLVFILNDQLIY